MTGGVTLSNKGKDRIPIFEKLIRGEINNETAAKMSGLSIRQCKRIKKEYKILGIMALVHKNQGKESNNSIPKDTIELAIKLIKEKYHDFGPTFALEKLQEKHEINFSVETLRKAMIANHLWKGKTRRKAHIHQPRTRREAEGELIQLDGSEHLWFESRGSMCTLIAYIDDATSKIVHAEFFQSESTWAYFNSFKKLLKLIGKPVALYSDKHGVFRINNTKNGSANSTDSHGLTQFGRVLNALNIKLINANSPQAKGRIERSFGTLQDRLVKELRLANIDNMEQANTFLPGFIEKHNQKFAVQPSSDVSAYRPILDCEDLEQIFTIQDKRILSKNLTCQFKNNLYLIHTKQSAYLLRKATVLVTENQENMVTIYYKGNQLQYTILKSFYDTQPLSRKEVNSKVDEALAVIRKHPSPPNSHPYKQRSYKLMLMKKQLA